MDKFLSNMYEEQEDLLTEAELSHEQTLKKIEKLNQRWDKEWTNELELIANKLFSNGMTIFCDWQYLKWNLNDELFTRKHESPTLFINNSVFDFKFKNNDTAILQIEKEIKAFQLFLNNSVEPKILTPQTNTFLQQINEIKANNLSLKNLLIEHDQKISVSHKILLEYKTKQTNEFVPCINNTKQTLVPNLCTHDTINNNNYYIITWIMVLSILNLVFCLLFILCKALLNLKILIIVSKKDFNARLLKHIKLEDYSIISLKDNNKIKLKKYFIDQNIDKLAYIVFDRGKENHQIFVQLKLLKKRNICHDTLAILFNNKSLSMFTYFDEGDSSDPLTPIIHGLVSLLIIHGKLKIFFCCSNGIGPISNVSVLIVWKFIILFLWYIGWCFWTFSFLFFIFWFTNTISLGLPIFLFTLLN